MTIRTRFTLWSLLWLLGVSPASAATIAFNPSEQSIELSQSATVDVVISDLGGEIVSAYDLDVLYDSSIVAATGVSFTTSLGDEFFFETLNSAILSTPGLVDLAQLSFLSDDDLFSRQGGGSVIVASIVFEAVGTGSTALDFVLDDVNDIKGRFGEVLLVDPAQGRISVRSSANVVPEPSAALLYFLGWAVVAQGLRRDHR